MENVRLLQIAITPVDGSYRKWIEFSVLKTLCSRYDNKRIIVNSLKKNLLSHPHITADSVDTIRALHHNTRECMASLKNVN